MSDYINRQAVIEYIKSKQCEKCSDIGLCGNCAVLTALKLVEKVSPVDVAPVVRGHWKNVKRVLNTEWGECSNCDRRNDITPYCPHCGAKMDESEEER